MVFCVASSQQSAIAAEADYKTKTEDDQVEVYRNDQLVTRLLKLSGHKPVLYPLNGPDQVPLSRAYPIEDAKPGEAKDHIHHRSLWFTHGEVNGVDFWAEGDHCGKIMQTSVATSDDGPGATITTTNDWVTPAGKTILTDKRVMTFHDAGDARAIDFDIRLTAGDEDVVFGDTKEGSFGVRMAGPMKVDAKQGGKITNSQGEHDKEAWGKPAEWVDYTGPAAGGTYGVTIMNHPSSFGYPTRWHVRTYGLFAANPFGVHHFVGGEATEGVRLKAGDAIQLRYRVLLHKGTTEEAGIAAQWEQYQAID